MISDETRLELEDELDKAQKVMADADERALVYEGMIREAQLEYTAAWERANAAEVLLGKTTLPESKSRTFGDE